VDPGPTSDADREPLFGRSEIVDEVDRLLEAARSGQGSCLLLSGVGGIGKTPLLHIARRHALQQGFRLAMGRALNEELPAPLSLVRELAGSQDPRHDASTAGRGVGEFPLSPVARTPAPPFDEFERLLLPVGPSRVEGPGAVRDQFYDRLVEYFLGLASDRPLLIAVDDLHFADRSSLDFLVRLAESIGTARIAILGTIGPLSDVSSRARRLLSPNGAGPLSRAIEIRPLSVPELTEFATWILRGAAPPPEDVLRWHAETEGNPLFAELLVRAETGSTSGPRVGPSTSLGLVETLLARTRTLDDTARRVLTYAAVLGREFGFSIVAAVTGADEERVTEAVDRLVRAGVVRERGGEVYEFLSEELRASVYSELTETRRRILHRKIGAALQSMGGASDFELARHFYLGREDAEAVEYNLRAAQAAARAFAFDTALEHVERALAAERRRPDRDRRRELRILTEEGRLLNETQNLPKASEVLEEAVTLGRKEPRFELELGRALLALAVVLVDRSEFASAVPLATEASELLEKAGTPRDLLSVHRTLGTSYWRLADLPRAESHQRRALEIAEKKGDALERGHALVDVANTLGSRGPEALDEALSLYGRAAVLFESVNTPSARARVLMNQAVFERWAGRTDAALRDIARALESAEKARAPLWIGHCLLNLGQWQADLGQAEKAQATIDRAARVVADLGDGLADEQIAMSRGMIAEAERKFPEAEAHYRDALARARSMELPSESAEVLFRLARTAQRRGALDEARSRLGEALSAGLPRHRPDLSPEVRELEAALALGH